MVPAPIGKGAASQLELAVKVHSACETFTEKKITIISNIPVSVSSAAVSIAIDKANKAASSGDLALAVASLDSLLGVAGGNTFVYRFICPLL